MNQPLQISRRTPFEDLPGFLTVDELSLYLGNSRGLCYERLNRGERSSIKFGRLIRVPTPAFEPPKPKAPTRSVSARALQYVL